MGMDVYGINPIPKKGLQKKEAQLRSQLEENRILDWKNATDEQKEKYIKLKDELEACSPGEYFRANVWGWRPIHAITIAACDEAGLEIDDMHWGSNDGYGVIGVGHEEMNEDGEAVTYNGPTYPDPAAMCNKIADAIESHIKDMEDTVYLNLGSWVDEKGQFIRTEDIERLFASQAEKNRLLLNGPIEAEINSKQEDDTLVLQKKMIYPAYSVSVEYLGTWIEFLRHCGGFQIW